MRRWILNRVRVLYKQRNMIQFLGGEYDLEPVDQGRQPYRFHHVSRRTNWTAARFPRPNVASWQRSGSRPANLCV